MSKVLETLYHMKMSPQTVSKPAQVAEKKMAKWKRRKLVSFHSVIFLDATFSPSRRGTAEKGPIYIALGILPDGRRETIGFWHSGGVEGANIWEEILGELRERGVRRCFFL